MLGSHTGQLCIDNIFWVTEVIETNEAKNKEIHITCGRFE